MSVRTVASAALLSGASLIILGTASPALAVCDAYSGGCPSPAPTSGGGGGGTATNGGGGTTSNPSTLPFTGGELVLMTALGAGALAGGTALVVAGRKRGSSPAA